MKSPWDVMSCLRAAQDKLEAHFLLKAPGRSWGLSTHYAIQAPGQGGGVFLPHFTDA